MKKKEHVGRYMEVWGDTVDPKELAIASMICVVWGLSVLSLEQRSLPGNFRQSVR